MSLFYLALLWPQNQGGGSMEGIGEEEFLLSLRKNDVTKEQLLASLSHFKGKLFL